MVNAKTLLDALVGAAARPGGLSGALSGVIGQSASGVKDAAAKAGGAPSLGEKVDQTIGAVAGGVADGQRPAALFDTAKKALASDPGLAEAALIGLAGILFGSRKPRGVRPNLAQLGGIALVGGLAYKAYENYRAGKPLLDLKAGTEATAEGPGSAPETPAARPAAASAAPPSISAATASASAQVELPEGSGFHPVSQTDDDILLYLRTMVAAASADGQIDAAERARIAKALNHAGIDEESTGWLEKEMTTPASVDELAESSTTPEKAAQIYSAARIAIDPDTIQEREFLRQLAEALDLDETLRSQIDGTAAAMKV